MAEKAKEMRGQERGGRGSVEASGKRHVAGPREGETREEEVGNLDPGMNDPLPLGARGVSLVALHPLLRPSRAPPLPPSIRADAVTTPPGSVLLSTLPPPRYTPFHSLFAGLTTHSYLRSSPFDHRHHPLAVLLFLPSKQRPFSFGFSSPLTLPLTLPLSTHSRSPRKLITGRVTLAASPLTRSRPFATLSSLVLRRERRRGRQDGRDDSESEISRPVYEPGDRAGFVSPGRVTF